MPVNETVATNIDRGVFEANDGNLDVDPNYGIVVQFSRGPLCLKIVPQLSLI